MSKLIKVHDNVYEELAILKKDNETFSEVIIRLITLFKLFQKVQDARKPVEVS
jgi:predicted CopG family antitoxin